MLAPLPRWEAASFASASRIKASTSSLGSNGASDGRSAASCWRIFHQRKTLAAITPIAVNAPQKMKKSLSDKPSSLPAAHTAAM